MSENNLDTDSSEDVSIKVPKNIHKRRNIILGVLLGAAILYGARVYQNIQQEPEMDLDKIMDRINRSHETVSPVPAEEIKPQNKDNNGVEEMDKKEKHHDLKDRKKSKDKPAKQEIQPEEDDYEYKLETALG